MEGLIIFHFLHWVLALISSSSPIFLWSCTCLYFLPGFWNSLCMINLFNIRLLILCFPKLSAIGFTNRSLSSNFRFLSSKQQPRFSLVVRVEWLFIHFAQFDLSRAFREIFALWALETEVRPEIFQVTEPLTEHCLPVILYFWDLTQASFSSLQYF